MQHDEVALLEALEDFGFEAILTADLDPLQMDDAVDNLKHGRFATDAEQ
jgi:hypothetical protein